MAPLPEKKNKTELENTEIVVAFMSNLCNYC